MHLWLLLRSAQEYYLLNLHICKIITINFSLVHPANETKHYILASCCTDSLIYYYSSGLFFQLLFNIQMILWFLPHCHMADEDWQPWTLHLQTQGKTAIQLHLKHTYGERYKLLQPVSGGNLDFKYQFQFLLLLVLINATLNKRIIQCITYKCTWWWSCVAKTCSTNSINMWMYCDSVCVGGGEENHVAIWTLKMLQK